MSRQRHASKTRYGIGEAKAHLSEIIDQIQATGQEVVVTRHGKPVVRLVPERADGTRRLGFAQGRVQFLPGWDDPIKYEDLFSA